MKSLAALALIVLAWFAYERATAPPHYPPGVLLAREPEQTEIASNDSSFDDGKFHLQPLARFVLDARVLHRKTYRYDRFASLVPVDLAVGWGPMSDQAVLDRLTISQSARFFFYEWRGQSPVPPEEIVAHATNLHLIPSSKAIGRQCKSLGTGDLIHLRGLLVEATGPDIGTWRSSLSRTDSGRGACELLWVEEVAKIGR